MSRLQTVVALLTVLLLTAARIEAVAQIDVDGKTIDSAGKPVAGVDVAIYVPGTDDPIASQKTQPGSGEYSFPGLSPAGAFDIVFAHSKYELAVVSRLAEREGQHVCKVIYRQQEPIPASAYHERLQAISRLAFLANATDNVEANRRFVDRYRKDLERFVGTPEVPNTMQKTWNVPPGTEIPERTQKFLNYEFHRAEVLAKVLLNE